MRKLWPKYEKWSKLGKQNRVYWYTLKSVPVHFCFWWGVPVHYCSCTGTPSIFCPDFVIFPTFDANSLHTTSIIHNTSRNIMEIIQKTTPQHLNWCFGTSKHKTLGETPRTLPKVHQFFIKPQNLIIPCLFSPNWGFTLITPTIQRFE